MKNCLEILIGDWRWKTIESINELKKICQDSKTEAEDWYCINVCRKITIYITKLLLYTPITANQVTLLSITTGFAAGVLFGSGTYFQSLAGALLLQLWLILDCVDGEVARYRGTTGICGKYVDTLNHCITEPFVFLCIGFGLHALFDNISIFVLGVLVALFMVWSSYSANLVYEIFVTGMHDMGDVVDIYMFRMKEKTINKVSTIRHIYNSCVKVPFSFSWYTVMILIATMLDILFIAFCPDIAIGGLTIAFGPDMDIIHLTGIFDHGLNFNFLYIYFIFFSIVSIIRGIVRIHNDFQGVCRYQQDAKQRQS